MAVDVPKTSTRGDCGVRRDAAYLESSFPARLVAVVKAWARDCWPAWGVGIIIVFLGAQTVWPWAISKIIPASNYYELRSVEIHDTVVGRSPTMIVDRTIHRQFEGRPVVEVLRVNGSTFEAWWQCNPNISGERTYYPDRTLPDPLTLDWWMIIPPNRCTLAPGQYKTTTTIHIRTWFGGRWTVMRDSNLFTVTTQEEN